MPDYFFDAYALIKILTGEASYGRFHHTPIATNALHLAEVYYFFLRTAGKLAADERLRQVKAILYEMSQAIALEAAAMRWEHREKGFSFADCIGYVTALEHGCLFVTGDFPFQGMPGVEFVK